MPYINVNDVYIMDNTGKQVDDAVDYALANSNRNLLDNPFFTVNQRNFSSSSEEGYTVDRWKLLRSNIITATLGNDGLTISKSVTGYAFFTQLIGTSIDLDATYTLSVMTSDGQVYSATSKFVNGTSSETYVSIGSMDVGFGLYGKNETPYVALYFGTSQMGSLTIKAIKLELGSYSTLANDVPPDYGEELRKCQRYFIRLKAAGTAAHIFGSGYATSNTNLRTLITLPVTMRSTPSKAFSGTFLVFGNGSNGLAVTNMTVGVVRANGIALGVTTSGLTANQTYHLTSQDSTAYLDFSADL